MCYVLALTDVSVRNGLNAVSFSTIFFCHTIPWQARRILISIYDMTQKIRCERIGKQQLDLARPLESMEQLIVKNCSPDCLVRRTGLCKDT